MKREREKRKKEKEREGSSSLTAGQPKLAFVVMVGRSQSWGAQTTGWVNTATDSLSDHRYIEVQVVAVADVPVRPAPTSHRWNLKKLDADTFRMIVMATADGSGTAVLAGPSASQIAECIVEQTERARSVAIPMKKASIARRRVYWWNDEIGKLHRDCSTMRQRVTVSHRFGRQAQARTETPGVGSHERTPRRSEKRPEPRSVARDD